jgi:hypothetical protein
MLKLSVWRDAWIQVWKLSIWSGAKRWDNELSGDTDGYRVLWLHLGHFWETTVYVLVSDCWTTLNMHWDCYVWQWWGSAAMERLMHTGVYYVLWWIWRPKHFDSSKLEVWGAAVSAKHLEIPLWTLILQFDKNRIRWLPRSPEENQRSSKLWSSHYDNSAKPVDWSPPLLQRNHKLLHQIWKEQGA